MGTAMGIKLHRLARFRKEKRNISFNGRLFLLTRAGEANVHIFVPFWWGRSQIKRRTMREEADRVGGRPRRTGRTSLRGLAQREMRGLKREEEEEFLFSASPKGGSA